MRQFLTMYVCYLTTLVYYIVPMTNLHNSLLETMPPEGKKRAI